MNDKERKELMKLYDESITEESDDSESLDFGNNELILKTQKKLLEDSGLLPSNSESNLFKTVSSISARSFIPYVSGGDIEARKLFSNDTLRRGGSSDQLLSDFFRGFNEERKQVGALGFNSTGL